VLLVLFSLCSVAGISISVCFAIDSVIPINVDIDVQISVIATVISLFFRLIIIIRVSRASSITHKEHDHDYSDYND
jgi:hypothetical protein